MSSVNKNDYYVYLLIDPRNNLPFYVGKGKKYRYLDHFKEYNLKKDFNKIKVNKILKIKKLGYDVIIQFYKKDIYEDEACKLEKFLINFYGRINLKTGILTNLTDGGEGVSGKVFTKEERELRRLRALGKNNPNYGNKWNQKQRQHLSNMKLGKFGTKHTQEWKEKMSKIQGNNPNNIKHQFYQFDKNGNLLKKWDSLTQFGKAHNLSYDSYRSRILQSLNNYSCSILGTYLREIDYKNIDLINKKVINIEDFLKEIDHRTVKKTIQKDLNGNIIKIWESRKQICESNSEINSSGLTWAVKNKKPYKGYYWE